MNGNANFNQTRSQNVNKIYSITIPCVSKRKPTAYGHTPTVRRSGNWSKIKALANFICDAAVRTYNRIQLLLFTEKFQITFK